MYRKSKLLLRKYMYRRQKQLQEKSKQVMLLAGVVEYMLIYSKEKIELGGAKRDDVTCCQV